MKKNFKYRITLFILMMFSLSLISCAVKRKSKEVEQIEINSEKQLQNDSAANLKIQKSSYEFLNNISSNETLLSKLGLVFNGTSNEDKGSFSIKETNQGLQVDISGALQMALDKTQSKEESFTKIEALQLFDSILTAKIQQNKIIRSNEAIESIKKQSENETTGMQFGAYLTGFGIICLILLLIWLWFYLKK